MVFKKQFKFMLMMKFIFIENREILMVKC
jgi:hypothetical protein